MPSRLASSLRRPNHISLLPSPQPRVIGSIHSFPPCRHRVPLDELRSCSHLFSPLLHAQQQPWKQDLQTPASILIALVIRYLKPQRTSVRPTGSSSQSLAHCRYNPPSARSGCARPSPSRPFTYSQPALFSHPRSFYPFVSLSASRLEHSSQWKQVHPTPARPATPTIINNNNTTNHGLYLPSQDAVQVCRCRGRFRRRLARRERRGRASPHGGPPALRRYPRP